MKRLVLVTFILASCGPLPDGTSGGSSRTPSPTTHSIAGSVTVSIEGSAQIIDTLQQVEGFRIGDPCTGRAAGRGFDDIDEGAQVLISNEEGQVIAKGYLGPGHFGHRACRFSFTVADVPSSRFYKVKVADRGGDVTLSRKEMEAEGWEVHLTLGTQ